MVEGAVWDMAVVRDGFGEESRMDVAGVVVVVLMLAPGGVVKFDCGGINWDSVEVVLGFGMGNGVWVVVESCIVVV